MSDLASIQKADRELLLSLEEPVNDLKSILGILVDLTGDMLDQRDEVKINAEDVAQIVFMITPGAQTAQKLQRLYYGEEAA